MADTKRDLTHEQYVGRLKKLGWSPVLLWLQHKDFPDNHIGITVNRRTGQVMRRATLRRLPAELRKLQAERAKTEVQA